jgi:hypothetical protein
MVDKFNMTVKVQWNGSDKGKPNNSEGNLSNCNAAHHKFHVN